jgi:hypothetical protein
MWEPQPFGTLRASTACTGITLPYLLSVCPLATSFQKTRKIGQIAITVHCREYFIQSRNFILEKIIQVNKFNILGSCSSILGKVGINHKIERHCYVWHYKKYQRIDIRVESFKTVAAMSGLYVCETWVMISRGRSRLKAA